MGVGDPPGKGAGTAGVEQIELRVLDLLRSPLQPPRLDPIADQGVDENTEEILNRLAADGGVPYDSSDIGGLRVLPGRDLQGSRKWPILRVRALALISSCKYVSA